MNFTIPAVIAIVLAAIGRRIATKNGVRSSKFKWFGIVAGLTAIIFLAITYGKTLLAMVSGVSQPLVWVGVAVIGLLAFTAFLNRRRLSDMIMGIIPLVIVLTLVGGFTMGVAAFTSALVSPSAADPATVAAVEEIPSEIRPPFPQPCAATRTAEVKVTMEGLTEVAHMQMHCTRVTLYPESPEAYLAFTPPQHCLDWTPDDGTVAAELTGAYTYAFSIGAKTRRANTPVTFEVYAVPLDGTYEGFECKAE